MIGVQGTHLSETQPFRPGAAEAPAGGLDLKGYSETSDH